MPSPVGNKRVLVAQADPLVALVLGQMLDILGFTDVLLVTMLDTALLTAKTATIDLAILDLQLTDGISQPIADVLAGSGVATIFTTADRAGGAFGLEASSVLRQPFMLGELLAAMDFAFCDDMWRLRSH